MKTIKRYLWVCGVLLVAACAKQAPELQATVTPEPIQVKVVVVSLFEIGADEGDQAGEFQLWKTRRGLDTKFEQKHAHHDLYMNTETGVLGMVTGIGTAKATAAIMALGLDPRFDLSKAYWLVAGIAGIDPYDAPIGSAAWASFVVDGDLSHEIDAREIPEDWETGYFARHTSKPYDPAKPEPTGGEMFALNPALADWAYELTKAIELPEYEGLTEASSAYVSFPATQQPPFILKGDNLAAMTFWHGAIMNEWANKWVDYWTEGNGEFVTSAMEDTGVMQALTYLHQSDLVDTQRVMMIRGGSNYTMPPPGVSAAENLLKENDGYSGLNASLETIYLAGGKVVDTLLGDWSVYSEHLPYE